MLIDDVKKIEKLKQKTDKNTKYKRKIEKIEKKHFSEHEIGNGIKSIYVDKHKSKVVVMENGDVLQVEGPITSPHFTGFLIAYFVLLLAGLPFILLGLFYPKFVPIAEAIDRVVVPAAILLNILTVLFHRTIMLKYKWLFVLLIMTFAFNVYNLLT